MRASIKVRKLAEPLTYSRAWTTIRRTAFPRRRFVLSLDRLVEGVDPTILESICHRYSVAAPGKAWPKYLQLDKWFKRNINRVSELGMDFGPKRRVLDLGSGAGYFLHICQRLGHEVLGLDIGDVPMYGEMMVALGVRRVIFRIKSFEPLPDLGGRFDLITGFMICFNDHSKGSCWREKEWSYFLEDLDTHLRPGGQVWLELNPERGGVHYTPELLEFFRSRGALIHDNRLVWGMSESTYKILSRKTGSRLVAHNFGEYTPSKVTVTLRG